MRKILCVLSALCWLSVPALSQSYPDRPITMIVPYAAGGPTDTVARIVSEKMGRELGQRVIVENVAGAGGTLGSARAARSEPNGYTLLLNHIGMSTAPTLYPGSTDPLTAFEFIGLVADVPMTIVARRSFPSNTLQELVEYAVKQGDKVSYAHAGAGTASHICGMLFAAETGAQPLTIPYKGTGPAMIDLLGGQVDFMCDQTTNTTNQIQAGEIRAYAVTAAHRIPALPNVPSVNEAGLGKMELSIWHGIYTPKGTPQEVRRRLTSALQAALADTAVLERFRQLSALAVSREEATPEGLKSKLTAETARWKKVLAVETQK
ncbi:tripartite tricarboxylate transporter substrate-binding protein [Bradyrhizobium sp. OAE829]|uniref:tripartite tricarboxylate transporter substrate-binding protein n=1 Tax=Bradyrhizobium sp. OAE829 TaxID=2663807 RepID=UPI00178C03FD